MTLSTDADSSFALHPSRVWFVQMAGQIWGPYGRARLDHFIAEGRLKAHSLIANDPDGPFQPAGTWPELIDALSKGSAEVRSAPVQANYVRQPPPDYRSAAPRRPSEPQAPVQPAPTRQGRVVPPVRRAAIAGTGNKVPASAAPASPAGAAPLPIANGALRPLVVWAECVTLSKPQFQELLATYGQIAVIRPGVWLVQATLDPAALRNALSRRLTGEDLLLILQAQLKEAAWFNLDRDIERPLRELWGRSEV